MGLYVLGVPYFRKHPRAIHIRMYSCCVPTSIYPRAQACRQRRSAFKAVGCLGDVLLELLSIPTKSYLFIFVIT